MRRVVFDVNVLVSGLINGAGPSARLVDAVRTGALDLVVSARLLAELGATLAKPRLARYVSPADAAEFCAAVSLWALHHPDPDDFDAREVRDPDDAYLIALCRVSGAEAVVSGDKDLVELDGQTLTLTPRNALTHFGLAE